eukprot:maker-scaffold5_size1054832-snap-gene-1.15 protein:Tk04020 transcript:maker-scaffold5_size1054832-snap-gene-1.15-mRNA-1 annotation:"leucine-rich repeat-containing protein 8e"
MGMVPHTPSKLVVTSSHFIVTPASSFLHFGKRKKSAGAKFGETFAMASLGNALVSKILGHSAAEKAFRPWWDNVEDFLVYGLVMLGLIVLPTAIINGTPLDCNFCQKDHCDGKLDRNRSEPHDDPGFNAWWVKKYCTFTSVDEFILYFPYILLIMALVIVLIERIFVRMFKAGLKLDTFYNLLVKESLESTTPIGGFRDSDNLEMSELENSKAALEVSHSFNQSSNYFLSYLLRTLIEFLAASFLLAWLIWRGFPSIQKEEFIYCDVHGYHYECAGHPQQFYMYVLFMVIAIIGLYLFCCFYNILWIIFPQLGVLSRVMNAYRSDMRQKADAKVDGVQISDRQLMGDLYDIYYNNSDLKLLLDLLAQSSGVAIAIRIMTLFDKNFRGKSEPMDFRVTKEGNKVKVEFSDPRTVKEFFLKIPHVSIIYTVEILPPTATSSVVAFKMNEDKTSFRKEGDETELQPLSTFGIQRKAEFSDLDDAKEYVVRVCTIVNGRAIAQKAKVIEATNPPKITTQEG